MNEEMIMNEELTEVAEDVIEETVTKDGSNPMVGAIIGLAVVGCAAIGFGAFKGVKAIKNKIGKKKSEKTVVNEDRTTNGKFEEVSNDSDDEE